VLVKNFDIKPIAATAEEDLEAILGPCWNRSKAECTEAEALEV
jgi:hypothetical protein